MKEDAVSAYRFNILKVYALVYSLVAIPILYYGINYIQLVNGHLAVSLPLFGIVMTLSVVAAFAVQSASNRHIRPFLEGKDVRSENYPLMIKNACAYPLRLVLVMVTGWIVMVNAIVLLPLFFLFPSTVSDLVVCNLIIVSCALMSMPMTFFISEKTVSSFLSLDGIKSVHGAAGTLRLSLTAKILVVCLVLIVTLILNTAVAMVLSVTYHLSETASVVNLAVISVQGVIATIVISLLFARSLKTPIANMSAGTGLVKSGDLTASIPRLSNDELGDTSGSFNAFVERLAEIVRDIKVSVRSTSENVVDLQKAMGDTDLSVAEIHRYSTEVQEAINSQSTIVTEVTATIQQIARTIENQDKRIHDQSSSVSESSSAIEEMIANIQSIAVSLQNSAREFGSLQTAISAGNRNVDDLKGNVLILSKQSDSVLEANTIIKNIASQTNLLAMNAAIEAAHAGDAGRGFAVVADEIRKLAEVSNQQSKLISDSLEVLKDTIGQAVGMTADTGKSFDDIIASVQKVNSLELEIKHAIDEQSSGGTQVLRALSGMNEITTEVHNGSAEMLTGSNMILAEVKNLLTITDQVQNSALNVVAKAGTVKDNTKRSLALLVRNTENMKKIDGMVGFFTVKG